MLNIGYLYIFEINAMHRVKGLSSGSVNVPSKRCARVPATGCETSAHKKLGARIDVPSKIVFFCAYFVHVVPNTDDSW